MSVTLCYGQTGLHSLYNKGIRSMKAGDYDTAIICYTKVLNSANDSSLIKNSYIYRALCFNKIEKFKLALIDLDSAIKYDSKDLLTYLDRAKTRQYLALYKDAMEDYSYVLAKDKTGKQAVPALFNLAKIAYKLGEYKTSIEYYDRLILLAPNIPEVYFNRGCAQGMLMNPEDAINDYNKAIQLEPNYKEAYANRGVSKINLLTTKGNIKPTKDQVSDGCFDLRKAKELGDSNVDDMIEIYCNRK